MKNKIWKSLFLIASLVLITVVGWGAYIVFDYLGSSPRFEVRKVSVVGLKRTEVTQVLAQADLPDKANIFAVDLTGIRERVEGLKWVRFATVQRVLPDVIGIKIMERQPIGLARIRGEILQFDSDAELLERDEGAGMNSPILDGLDPEDREGNKTKVDLYLRIMEDLHGQSELSQIRINDSGEVAVVSLNEPLLVHLGSSEFRKRWGQFLQLREQIQNDYPEAAQVDFRFANQVILKMGADAPEEEKVVWDAEKKSL
jgi:cell division protein FtsQ